MRIFIFFLLIFSNLICFSQSDSIKIKTSGNFFTTDAFKNIYTIDNEKITRLEVEKNYSKSIYYSHDYFGKISSIDVSNPFKILVYYKEYNQIVFLDKNLSEIGNIDLSEVEIEFSGAACFSKNKNVWIFDNESNRIIHLNKYLKKNLKTPPLNTLIENEIEITQLTEGNIGLVALVKDFGLLFFDEFGSYLRSLPLKNITNFQLIKDKIVIKTTDSLFSYNYKLLEMKKLDLEIANYRNIRIELDKVFIQNKNEIIITDLMIKL